MTKTVVLLPMSFVDPQAALDLIAEWCNGYNITTVHILNQLLPTSDMSTREARDHIEYNELDALSIINGHPSHIDPANDAMNRAMLLESYMCVRDYIIQPLTRELNIKRFRSIGDRGCVYEITYV